MAEAPTPVEQAVDTLDRLRRHVDAIRKGEATARDDLAVVLHLLVGAGDGYGVIQNAVDYLGVSPPDLAVWGTEVPIQIDGAPVTLAIRSARHDEDAAVLSLPDALQEVCLRFAIPGVAPEANWSWEGVIRKVRNKFGGHLDGKPPVWLQDLRYYPVADTDAVTFLLWSIGEAILSTTTHHLYNHGVDVVVFEPEDKYLNGISFEQGYVIQESETKLDVQAQLACDRWASGRRRAVLGGRFADRPFIFGIEGDARLTLQQGEEGASLRDLETEFRSSLGLLDGQIVQCDGRPPSEPETGDSRLDKHLAERHMTLVELSDLVGITVANLSIPKNDRAVPSGSQH